MKKIFLVLIFAFFAQIQFSNAQSRWDGVLKF